MLILTIVFTRLGTLGRFALGLDLAIKENVEISASYNPQIGKDFHGNAGMARLTWRF